MLWLAGHSLHSQLMVGWNAAPLAGGTLEFHAWLHPKNEDWFSLTGGGGYTLMGPFLLDKKEECLRNVRHGGYHFRLGARNSLTTDHHSNYFFWGAQVIYSLQKERALYYTCDSTRSPETIERKFSVLSGSVQAGYSWNPWRRKSILHPFQFDFGLQVGFPLWRNGEFQSARNYISGLGYGNLPIRSVNLEAIAIVRFELAHFKYGYKRFKKDKR